MNTHIIGKPALSDYAAYYHTYVNEVEGSDLVAALSAGQEVMTAFLQALPEDKLNYSYGAGKWTIKEVVMHLMDAERIFVYRSLRFSRGDGSALQGFDDDEYVANSNAKARSRQSLIEEYIAVRQATIALYKNLSPEMYDRGGIANGNEMTVAALGYIIAGHEIHHLRIIKERYL